MCFSATASFVAGGALVATGAVTISKTHSREELPLACIPLLLGLQQLIEGVVWISFGHPLVNVMATHAYSMFSHVLWPMYVPVAIMLIEANTLRRETLSLFSLLGFSLGMYLLYTIITYPVTAHVVEHSIAYDSPHFYSLIILLMYLVTICGSCYMSSHKIINILGLVLIISFFIAGWFYVETFFSVWCFFGAILSFIIFLYFQMRE